MHSEVKSLSHLLDADIPRWGGQGHECSVLAQLSDREDHSTTRVRDSRVQLRMFLPVGQGLNLCSGT
jgi:hypothetical protein